MHSIFAFGFASRLSLVCSSILAALLAYFSSPTQVLRSLVLMRPNLLLCCISVLLLEGFVYCSASCRSYFMLACERDVSAYFSRYTCFKCCGGGVARCALRHFRIYVRSQRMCLYLLGYNSNCGVQLCSDLVAVGRFLTSAHANLQRLPSEPQEGAAGIEEIQSQFPSAVASFADNKSAQQPGEG